MYKKIFLFLLLVATATGCKPKQEDEATDTLVSGVIRIAADEEMRRIVEAELDVFALHFPEAFVFPKYFDEKQTIDYLINDSVKLAIVGRQLDARELSLLPPTRIVRTYPFGYEGIAFVINRQNPDSIATVKQIEAIIMGKINTWTEINPSSSLDSIKIFFASRQSGIMRYISDSITRGSQDVSKRFFHLNEGEDIFDKIASDPNNIGIVGMNLMGNLNSNQYAENERKVRLIRVSKEAKATLDNSYLPYAGDLYNGNYPFWRPLYILLSETREGLPRGLSFFLTQQIGQKVIQKAGLMPITDVHKTMTRWND